MASAQGIGSCSRPFDMIYHELHGRHPEAYPPEKIAIRL